MIDELKIVQDKIEAEILEKIDQVKENIIAGKGPGGYNQIEMLAMINDELSDVLLNWEPRLFDNELGDDLY